MERRRVDDAHHRAAVLDDRDVDRELAVLRDELLGAVERIDECEPAAVFGHVSAGHRFFGDHLKVRLGLGEPLQDDRFGKAVRLRQKGRIQLCLDREIGAVDAHDLLASGEGNAGEGFGGDGHGVTASR